MTSEAESPWEDVWEIIGAAGNQVTALHMLTLIIPRTNEYRNTRANSTKDAGPKTGSCKTGDSFRCSKNWVMWEGKELFHYSVSVV